MMNRKSAITLAAMVMLALGVWVACQRIGFWMITGRFFPIREIETLQHPVPVASWDTAALHLADGRTVQLPGVSALPADSPALREALQCGIELRQDGRVWALVRIHHWCGNDPVREHVAKVDLSDLMIFLRVGEPAAADQETEFLAREPGGSFSEFGWNISEFLQFQSWQLTKSGEGKLTNRS